MGDTLFRPLFKTALLGLALVGAFSAAPTAHATSLVDLSDADLTDAAAYIVVGQVVEVWTEFAESDGLLWTRARVRVDSNLKGPKGAPAEITVDTIGGQLGDVVMNVPSSARFSEGEEVILFLDDISDHRLTPTGMYLGKYTIRRAPGDKKSYVRRWTTHRSEPYDHRFLPHPPSDQRLPLEDLLKTINSSLADGWNGQPIPGLSTEQLNQLNTPARRHLQ